MPIYGGSVVATLQVQQMTMISLFTARLAHNLLYIVVLSSINPIHDLHSDQLRALLRSYAHSQTSVTLLAKAGTCLPSSLFSFHKDHLPPFPPISDPSSSSPRPTHRQGGKTAWFKNAWSFCALWPPPGDRERASCQTSHGGTVKNTCIPLLIIYWWSLPPFMFMRLEASLWPRTLTPEGPAGCPRKCLFPLI